MNKIWRVAKRHWLGRGMSFRRAIFTYFSFVFLVAPIVVRQDYNVSLKPVELYALLWILAFVFPILAVAYNLSRVAVSAKTVVDLSNREGLWRVYIPPSENTDEEDRQLEFRRYIFERLDETYNVVEYAIFSFLAASLTFGLGYILLTQLVHEPNQSRIFLSDGTPTWATIVGSGFLGAYSGSVVLMLRRYRTSDLRPTTFLQVVVALVAGTLFGAFLTTVYPVIQLSLLAFAAGFMSAANINFLSQEVRRQYVQLTGARPVDDDSSDLSEVVADAETIEALKRSSVYSIRELAYSDPIRIYFAIPQDLGVVLALIDEAILKTHFATAVSKLQRVHIRSFSPTGVAAWRAV